MQQTFTKSERLCSKKILGELFKKGSAAVRTFYLFPFRVLYLPQPESISSSNVSLPAIVITVPKRTFKRAVDRNLIRRRVREAYRLNKHLFQLENPSTGQSIPAYIAFLYTAKQIISFEEIEKGMKLAIAKCIVNNAK
ncbi:ribonuclease P protein component [Spirosoma gilvum]